jgi:ABC-type glutathione transport system ATPase component
MKLLEAENISIGMAAQNSSAPERLLVQEASFSLERGKTFGLLGSSGSGKTLLACALCGLLNPPVRLLGGSIRFAGETLHPGPKRRLISKRGRHIFMIFQSAAAALNPYMSVGRQIAEAVTLKERQPRQAAMRRAEALLERVGLSPTAAAAHPFQLSGGMQQRVLIAIALALRPEVLIADEPTTGLDAVSELRILELLRSLQEEGMAMLFISHDLNALAFLADHAGVMTGGRIVESGPARELLTSPQHSCTRELTAALAATGKIQPASAMTRPLPAAALAAAPAGHGSC